MPSFQNRRTGGVFPAYLKKKHEGRKTNRCRNQNSFSHLHAAIPLRSLLIHSSALLVPTNRQSAHLTKCTERMVMSFRCSMIHPAVIRHDVSLRLPYVGGQTIAPDICRARKVRTRQDTVVANDHQPRRRLGTVPQKRNRRCLTATVRVKRCGKSAPLLR